MEVIISNIINKIMLLKVMFGPDLTDLYPTIIKIIYRPNIVKVFIFGSTNIFKILEGLMGTVGTMGSDSFLRSICEAIELRARCLNLKTPKQYNRFLDYCIVLFLSVRSKSISSYDKDPVITFRKMLGMLSINTCGEFIIEKGLLGIYNGTFTQTFYFNRGMSVDKTHRTIELHMKKCTKLPKEYTNIIVKIIKMYLNADSMIDKEINETRQNEIKYLIEFLKDQRKNPIQYVCKKFNFDLKFKNDVFISIKVIKEEKESKFE